ncbi:MAG: hypothetical protein HQL29_00150 [Candidatus Omnitrophica bacterium]|nr:hypothetical protein [Candidatus Omnitrophota bacterium]
MEMKLTDKVKQLGYYFFEKDQNDNIYKILCDVLKSNETRFLEGFPVMLLNAFYQQDFEYDQFVQMKKRQQIGKEFNDYIFLALALYKFKNLHSQKVDRLWGTLTQKESHRIDQFHKSLLDHQLFQIHEYSFDPGKLDNLFNMYFSKEDITRANEIAKRQETLSFDFALGQFFPSKQREICLKRLKGEILSKTEKEYYSRVIKKKLVALSNDELHRIAKILIEL